jgi:hypothetical protein
MMKRARKKSVKEGVVKESEFTQNIVPNVVLKPTK